MTRARQWLFALAVLLAAGTPEFGVRAATLDFESSIAFPGSVRTQFCAQGVEFIEPVRIVTPAVATASPTRAITNRFPGQEFHEPDTIRIAFSAAQTAVAVKVGLDRQYGDTVTARLWGFSTSTPQPSGVETTASVNLGTGPTAIATPLSITSATATIRSVMVEFFMPGSLFAYEWLDDLTFSIQGPPCGTTDSTAPSVQLIEPATPGQTVYSTNLLIDFSAVDPISGVARVDVSFATIGGSVLESFTVCGGSFAPCPVAKSVPLRYGFNTFLPAKLAPGSHPLLLRVEAWDYAGNRGMAERGIIYEAFGPGINVWPGAITITQAVQPWLGRNAASKAASPRSIRYPFAPSAVPLAARRTTVVRVIPQVEGSDGRQVDGLTATLRCYTDPFFKLPCPGPSKVEPSDITAPGGLPRSTRQVAAIATLDVDTLRQFGTAAWNFQLPSQWTQPGVVHLEAEIYPPAGLTECTQCTGAANRLRVTYVRFREVPGFNQQLTRLGALNRDGTKMPTATEIRKHVDYIRKTYPIDESTAVTAYFHWTYDDKGGDVSQGNSNACAKLLDAMDAGLSKRGRRTIQIITDSTAPRLCSGLGRSDGYAVSRGSVSYSSAHETGHAFGLLHAGNPPGHGAECAQSGYCDTDWPWPHGTTGAQGFDVFDFTVMRPGTFETDPHDVMSYGGQSWMSSRTWTRLFGAFTGVNFPYPKPSPATSATQGTRTYALIRGAVTDAGAWSLRPVYALDLPADTGDDVGEGDYALELMDADMNVLQTRRFSVGSDYIDRESASLEPPPARFVQRVPLPAGTTTIVLQRGEEILATVARSASVPAVQVLSPGGDGFTGGSDAAHIGWSGADTDGDPLFYLVQYGVRPVAPGSERDWQTLTIDATGDSLSVPFEALAGGDDVAVRVLATDGFNTAIAQSPAFSLAGTPPVAEILYPASGSLFRARQRVVLRGAGWDREDGVLPAANASWRSHRDGPLGTGYVLDSATLSPGVHELTLRVTDSTGASADAAISIEVLAHRNHQPRADAGEDRVMPTGDEATLDGAGSRDADGDPLSFAWTFVRTPANANPVFTSDDTAQAGLITDLDGEYEIALVVSDGLTESVRDTALVHSVGRSTDSDGDGLPDPWELANGLDRLVDDADLDADGDGFSNGEEFGRKTDPQDPLSYPLIPLVFPVTELTTAQLEPAIAYAAADERYLVAWQDLFTRSNARIAGRSLDALGEGVGAEFAIGTDGTGRHIAPGVAYNHQSNEFLVVWQYQYSVDDHDIYAQRVSPAGTLLGAQIPVATRVAFESSPAVAYNAVRDEYLVVWEQLAGSDEFTHNDIMARRLDGQGNLVAPAFAIADGGLDESAPAVAHGESTDRYLVVWQAIQAGSGEYDLVTRTLDGEGTPLAGGPVVSWEHDQVAPRVAYNAALDEFLVVWQDHHWAFGAARDIYGQRIRADGAAVGGNFAISWLGAQARLSPDVVYNRATGEYLVAWEYAYSSTDHDVYVRRVGGDATLRGAETVVSNRVSHETRPRLASNDGDAFLVVWEDARNEPNSGIDVYAARIRVPVGAQERCDGIDNDLDGETDEAFADSDGDGAADCVDEDDDGDGLPDAVELEAGSDPLDAGSLPEMCDGADNDGDGAVDEGFDRDGDGFATCGGDCDDGDPTINPSATEICDGLDNNCDTAVDEFFDADGDAYTTCGGDCADLEPLANPGLSETCDLIDNNCDGQIDEGFDADGDGTQDCVDGCPADAGKTSPGQCGCGEVDLDTDVDGEADCLDGDDDDDGYGDDQELEAGSDPLSRLSRPVRLDLELEPGLNLVAVPVDADATPDAYSLLAELGGPDSVRAVLRFDVASGRFVGAHFDAGSNPAGENFAIHSAQGLAVVAERSRDVLFEGVISCPALALEPGLNLIAAPCVADGYRASQLLLDLGGEAVVASVQRYDVQRGRTDTVAAHDGRIAGIDFPIVPGQSYIVHMRAAVTSFRLD